MSAKYHVYSCPGKPTLVEPAPVGRAWKRIAILRRKGYALAGTAATFEAADALARRHDMKKNPPRPAKGTPTDLNLQVLATLFRGGKTEVPNRLDAVDVPHLRRCFKAGLLEVHRASGTLRLTPAGQKAIEGVRPFMGPPLAPNSRKPYSKAQRRFLRASNAEEMRDVLEDELWDFLNGGSGPVEMFRPIMDDAGVKDPDAISAGRLMLEQLQNASARQVRDYYGWRMRLIDERLPSRNPVLQNPPPVYVAIGPTGQIGAVGTHAEAVAAARALAPAQIIDPPIAPSRNPPDEDPVGMPAKAFKSCGVPKVSWDEVRAMSLEEAHKRLAPFFYKMKWWREKPTKAEPRGWHNGKESEKNRSPTALANSILTSNAKLDKAAKKIAKDPAIRAKQEEVLARAGAKKIVVMGLSLLPHALVHDVVAHPEFTEFKNDLRLPLAKPLGPLGFCVGSSQGCRDACLAYSGHSWSIKYNSKLKTAKTLALLRQPVAFVKFLYESCLHVAAKHKGEAAVFIRLNVFSDIPWEIVCPWLFDKVRTPDGKRVSFYDYSKVAGRKTPANYDLTFSYSGENLNLCKRELERGRRIAVVFLGMRHEGANTWEAIGARGEELIGLVPLPKKFWGRRVVDGDVSDMRPLDPKSPDGGPVVVGLRYKIPHSQEVDATDPAFSFVTPAYIVRGRPYLGPDRNPDDDVEYLIAPMPAHATPFEDAEEAGPDADGEALLETIVQYGGEVRVDLDGQLGATERVKVE